MLVKNKKNKKSVLGYTSLFVLVSSSFLSSLYLQYFTIPQATLRRDYLRQAFSQQIIFTSKDVLVKKKKKKKRKKKKKKKKKKRNK